MFKQIGVILLVQFGQILGNLTQLVDLTWDFNNSTIYWGNITPFSYTKVVENTSQLGYWYAMKEFCSGEHGGTHLDAPYHFNQNGWKVADIPIARLIGEGALIDLSRNKNSEDLLPKHLESWIHDNGEFKNNTILLIKFGRSKLWNNKTEYMSADESGKLHFPVLEGISKDAAIWIASSGKIVGVGLDTPSVDPGKISEMFTHRILSEKQIYNMENVKLLADLPSKDFLIIALPMKLEEGTGAPLRVIAIPKGYA